jgi:predicted amidophosphoribosyltransferase
LSHVAPPDLIGLLLPRRCAVCRLPGEDVCARCVASFPPVPAPLCERCGAPTAWPVERCSECAGRRLAFAGARAGVVYDAGVRAFVRSWKEHGLRGLARVASSIVVERVPRPSAEAVSFVPADADRGRRRGYNPAEALARHLAADWELELLAAVGRTRTVRRQATLPLRERRRNVAGSFAPTARVPRRVVLVDDVYTTGATASAAASALRSGGARRVSVVTFARVVR